MALINRVVRLFRADMHAILDRIEEPDVLLKQSIRDMEAHITHDEYQVKSLNGELSELRARQAELARSQGNMEEELDVCFTAGNHDLARVLIKRKLESQQLINYLSRKCAAMESTVSEYSTRLEENRTMLLSLQQKAEVLAADVSPSIEENYSRQGWGAEFSVRNDEVEIAFLREQQKRESL